MARIEAGRVPGTAESLEHGQQGGYNRPVARRDGGAPPSAPRGRQGESAMAAPSKALPRAGAWSTVSGTWLLRLLLVLFFLSGISGLIYQVLWLRILSLVFGVTVFAVSTVLASFMAGLAVGSFGAGKLADRLRNPLAVYGAVEVCIGLTALVTPEAILGLQGIYRGLYGEEVSETDVRPGGPVRRGRR